MQFTCLTYPVTNHSMPDKMEKAEQKLPLRCQGVIRASQESGNQGVKSKRNLHPSLVQAYVSPISWSYPAASPASAFHVFAL